MKKLSFTKLTISRLDNLPAIKGGGYTLTCHVITGTDSISIEEPDDDIFTKD